jgi:ubiquinone/menaquinone biosynthesis C-methylase UbiE
MRIVVEFTQRVKTDRVPTSRLKYTPPVPEEESRLPGLSANSARSQQMWDSFSDEYQELHGDQLAKSGGNAWGTAQVPESKLRILGEVAGKDVLELGCGAAQWSIALALRGARMVGLDLSQRQLEHARRLMAEAGVDFRLVHASAENVPLPDASFDIVFCDHGGMTFADPYRTVPEVARLLKSGGLFAFNHHSPFETVCWPADADEVGDRLVLDYFGLHSIDDGEETVFQLPYGEWIRLFRANHFAIEDLIEPVPEPNATSSYRSAEALAWARRWPAESIWRLRRE